MNSLQSRCLSNTYIDLFRDLVGQEILPETYLEESSKLLSKTIEECKSGFYPMDSDENSYIGMNMAVLMTSKFVIREPNGGVWKVTSDVDILMYISSFDKLRYFFLFIAQKYDFEF